MMMTRALREAFACYRTANDTKDDAARASIEERAQDFGVVAGVSALLTTLSVISWLLFARCMGEVTGAGLAASVSGLSAWVASEHLNASLSTVGYAVSWAVAASALAAAERRLCGTMLEGLGMSPKE